MRKSFPNRGPALPDPVPTALEIAVLFVADEAQLGHAGALDLGQHLVDDDVAGGRVGLELQFGLDRQPQRLLQILTQGQQVDGRTVPGDDAAGIDRHLVLDRVDDRSEEHTSELQSLMRNSYAVFCLKKKTNNNKKANNTTLL